MDHCLLREGMCNLGQNKMKENGYGERINRKLSHQKKLERNNGKYYTCTWEKLMEWLYVW